MTTAQCWHHQDGQQEKLLQRTQIQEAADSMCSRVRTNPCEGTSCTLEEGNNVWMDPQHCRKSSSQPVEQEAAPGSITPSIHPSQLGCGLIQGPQSTLHCHTLDSRLFVDFPASFSFSGSALSWLASLSCFLRIRCMAPKHRKAPTSKKNCSPRYLWGADSAGQGAGMFLRAPGTGPGTLFQAWALPRTGSCAGVTPGCRGVSPGVPGALPRS